jgi:hypothetical protein
MYVHTPYIDADVKGGGGVRLTGYRPRGPEARPKPPSPGKIKPNEFEHILRESWELVKGNGATIADYVIV